MKFNIPFNNFTSGEWSPKMLARTDTEQYPRACVQLQNFIARTYGGAFRRTGTRYVSSAPGVDGNTINLNYPHRLIPFVSSTGNSYVLIMGRTGPTIDGIPATARWAVYDPLFGTYTNVTGETTLSVSDYGTLQYVQVGDYLVFANNGQKPFLVRPPKFAADSGTWQAYAYLGSSPLEVPAPYSTWKTHPFDPLQGANLGGTITATGTFTQGGSVTLTTSNDKFVSGTDVGTALKLTSGATTGVVIITGVTNATTATGTVQVALPGTSPTTYGAAANTSFQISAWRGMTGYPKVVAAFQGRVYWGSTTAYPDTIWATRIGNIWEMDEIPLAQDPSFTGGAFLEDNSRPFTITPNTPEASNITAMTSAKTLVVHTDRSELVAYGTQGALGPNDFQIESSSSYGAARVQPVRVNNFLTFVQRGGRKLRDLTFDWNESQYKSSDLGFVADHLTLDGGIFHLDSAELGSSVLLALTDDGRLMTATLDRDYNINAWSTCVLGGSYVFGPGAKPQVCSVASVPRAIHTNKGDQVFVTVKRTISSITLTYLEYLAPEYEFPTFDHDDAPADDFPYYVDSAVHATSGAPQTVWNGVAGHLAGEVVSVIGDGLYLGNFIVGTSIGNPITLPLAVSDIVVGLQYTSRLETVPIEYGAQTGSAVGRFKRVHELYFRLFNTYGMKYGTNRDSVLRDVVFNRNTTPMNEAVPFFTGDIFHKNTMGLDRSYTAIVETSYPFPCNVLGIGVQGVTYD